MSKDGILKLHYGYYDELKEFTFREKESSALPVKNIENRCFIIWQNDEYLYKKDVEKNIKFYNSYSCQYKTHLKNNDYF